MTDEVKSAQHSALAGVLRDVVLFDLDGTVLDTHDAIVDGLRYATQKVLGRIIPDDVLVAEVGQPLVHQMNTFAEGNEELREELLTIYRSRNERDLDERTHPYAGIPELIDKLNAEGYTVGVVTSKREALATKSLKAFGLYDKFARVNGMESSKGHKPDPDPLIQAASDLGVTFDRCIYIGDSPYDIQAAHGARIPVIGVTWGKFFSREKLEANAPMAIVERCEDLLDVIHQLTK